MSKKIVLESEHGRMVYEVPSIAFGFDVNNYGDSSELMFMIPIESMDSCHSDETLKTIPLPKGNWRIISKQ